MPAHAADWLWGWDPTPHIVSVWAEDDGRAHVWRRDPQTGILTRDEHRFRPWMLVRYLDDLRHLGGKLAPDGDANALVTWRELNGPGELRYLATARHQKTLTTALLAGASKRLGARLDHVRDLDETGDDQYLLLPPDEQFLVATGKAYFRDLVYQNLYRFQFDLETTGLDPSRHRMFLVAVRHPNGETDTLEAPTHDDAGEAALIRLLLERIRVVDPDVIENHNLHGFDLPFLEARARRLRVPLALGRLPKHGVKQRGARRGAPSGRDDGRRVRWLAPGRELIDTMDAVRHYDHTVRPLPSFGLKALARHFGIAGPDRELIPGAEIYNTYIIDPERVRRYATADVEEVAQLSELLGGAAFALARMTPRRYERMADAGSAAGVIDPMLVRAYVRDNTALPAHRHGDDTIHTGAALHLFAVGVAQRVVKADVASLYPSLMRAFRIGPARDHLGALLTLVDTLVETRLDAKARARAAPAGSAERHSNEAMSAAMKIVVNSAYGYMAAGGELTRFADVHAANEVTRRGRETLNLMCRELAARDVTLIEADTDGVYFAVPRTWTETDERRVVSEVAALLPPLVQLEFDGRYAAVLSHEPKNYALLSYDDTLTLTGVAFRSSRMEPFAQAFLRRAIEHLLKGEIVGVRDVYLATIDGLRRHEFSRYDVSSRMRLTKSPEEYAAARETRKEIQYEAMLASGRTGWDAGERVRVYRKRNGAGGIVDAETSDIVVEDVEQRDYDVEGYVRLLRDQFAARMARAFAPNDYAAVFPDPDQLGFFVPDVHDVHAVLTNPPVTAATP